MKLSHFAYVLFFPAVWLIVLLLGTGCAQIGSPTGGPRDSIPPVLISANPAMLTTNFNEKKITFVFNEYIDVQEIQANLLVSPYPKVNPQVDFKLRTVTVKLKDTLLPNTTYAINFGKAIRDNNEGNPFPNFTYVFSTGNTIDSLQLGGKVIIAETGKTDSTIIALLYRNVEDSAVQKRKPEYIARLDSTGNFMFSNLAAGNYKLYALKDGDGSKTYNSATELFAFLQQEVAVTGDSINTLTLYAYAAEKDDKKVPAVGGRPATAADKRLRYTSTLSNNEQDLLTDLVITSNKPLTTFESQKIILTDTNFNRVSSTVTLDSTQKNITLKTSWQRDAHYLLILDKTAFSDSMGLQLTKTDTIRFKSKKESDYGTLVLRFTNLASVSNPVLQFVRGEELFKSVPITAATYTDKLFVPGEYELRILFDDNKNGVWDPGNYEKKLQPEMAITLDKNLNIKANWDNERDIRL